MVQIVNQFPGKDLPLIDGLKIDQYVPNECIIKNDEIKTKALKECLRMANVKEIKSKIYSINIKDAYNIIYKTKDGIEIRLGDCSNLDYKLSYALSILNSNAVKGSKGYIEIQQDGSAIFKKAQ
jgi:cell division protein FtsQ